MNERRGLLDAILAGPGDSALFDVDPKGGSELAG